MSDFKPRCTIVNNILFSDNEDEEDDLTVLNEFRARFPQPQEKQRQLLIEKQRQIEQRTLDATARSIAKLQETEDIGICAAVKIAGQGDQLRNTNRRLDDIDANLKCSQKHINGIQSVFYGIKNIFGKADALPIQSKKKVSCGPPDLVSKNPTQCTEPDVNSQLFGDILEANLDIMSSHISRLKGLGLDIGNEISEQNKLIEKIQEKVEVADIKIGKQNKQMNKILGK